MTFTIVPFSIEHLPGFRDVFDSVARERKFLVFLEAPPIEAVRDYVTRSMERGSPHFLALADSRVVGWCDASTSEREGFRHTGYLGIGVQRGYRGQGIGKALLGRTIEAAFAGSLSRIELDVFASNASAKKLYEAFDFVVEGRKMNARIIDGATDDVIVMSLLKPAEERKI